MVSECFCFSGCRFGCRFAQIAIPELTFLIDITI
jgi:hypothetical protein